MKDNRNNSKSTIWINLALILVVILLAVAPLVFLENAEFSGADGEAEAQIVQIAPHYSPWFKPLFEPASGEIESMLFALQAAAGSGVLFYWLGYLKGRNKKEEGN
jgi:cobalt/nickel transport protein